MAGISLPQDQYKKIAGLNIRYWQEGQEGPWLILLHGIGACVNYWQENISELSKQFRVLAVDLPGFGKSGKPIVDYTLEYYETFLVELVKEFAIDQFYLAAHSLGGAIALQYVTQHPDKVKKLVLLDNVGFATEVIIFFRLMSLPLLGEWLTSLSKSMFIKALKTNVFDPAVITPAFGEVVYELSHLPETRRTVLNILRQHTNLFGIKSSSLQPIWDNFDKLNHIPILLFWGKNDRLLNGKVHVPAGQEFLPHMQVRWLENCGHIPQMEYPEIINQSMQEFLLSH